MHRKLILEQTSLGFLLLLVAGLAWGRTFHDALNMNCIMTMPAMHGSWWTGLPLYMLAWTIMMAAMMLPAIAPMVLLFARVSRRRNTNLHIALPWMFIFGYGIIWSAMGVPAYFATLWLQAIAGHHPNFISWESKLGAITLIGAGIYQLSPAKNACLRHCTTPLHFILQHWRDGWRGAVRMGIEHGLICAVCCIGLMAVLFALGVMNLMWMIVIAVVILTERILPSGNLVSRVTGGMLLIAGISALCISSVARLLSL